jgi:solute carrier family 13 (sodium-dependent dicarboxylate transporter), member 2/3/5
MLIASRSELRRLIGTLEVSTWRPLLVAIACVLGALAVALLPDHVGLSDAGRWALFILILAAALWVTEAIPAFAVGLAVIGLEIAILGREGGPFATSPDHWKIFIEPWGSPLIWLFFGGFVLARGIGASRLDRWLSLAVLHRFGGTPKATLLGAMAVTFTFSMFASNTATATMMIAALVPIVRARQRDGLGKALLLGVAFAGNIGGMASLIGTPPNAIAAGALASHDSIGFARWLLIGLPPAAILLIVAWLFLLWRHPPDPHPVDLSALQAEGTDARLPRWRRIVVIAVVVATIGAWMTEPLHGASPPVVAFVPVTVLTVSGVLRPTDIRTLEWDILLLMAGGLALGVAVSETDLARWLVSHLPMSGVSPLAIATLLALATAVLSNFMSNTAAANVVIPMAIALAPGFEAAAAVPVALAASAAMCLPVSTPPNAIAYATGHVTTRDFILGGVLIGLLGTGLTTGWSWLVLS